MGYYCIVKQKNLKFGRLDKNMVTVYEKPREMLLNVDNEVSVKRKTKLIKSANDELIFICGTLLPHGFFYRSFNDGLEEAIKDRNVKVLLVTGPKVSLPKTEQYPGNGFVELLAKRKTDFDIYVNLTLYSLQDRRPEFHYTVADKRLVMAEAWHGEGDEKRTLLLYDDGKVGQACELATLQLLGNEVMRISDSRDYEQCAPQQIPDRTPVDFDQRAPDVWVGNRIAQLVEKYWAVKRDFPSQEQIEHQCELMEIPPKMKSGIDSRYVAICHGEIIAQGDDFIALCRRVRKEQQSTDFFIREVEEKPIEVDPMKYGLL